MFMATTPKDVEVKIDIQSQNSKGKAVVGNGEFQVTIVQIDDFTAEIRAEGRAQAVAWWKSQTQLRKNCYSERTNDDKVYIIKLDLDNQNKKLNIATFLSECGISFTPLKRTESFTSPLKPHQESHQELPRKLHQGQHQESDQKSHQESSRELPQGSPQISISPFKIRQDYLEQFSLGKLTRVNLLGTEYKILRKVGEGSYGIVFEAECLGIAESPKSTEYLGSPENQKFQVKDQNPLSKPQKRALKLLKKPNDDEHEAFEKMKKAAGDYPNIVKYYGSELTAVGVRWLVLEWVDSQYSLKSIEQPSQTMLFQYRTAMESLRKLDITVYDESLDNALIDGQGQVKLIDFGSTLARN